jgi:DNA-binding SARP family transcriptional activator
MRLDPELRAMGMLQIAVLGPFTLHDAAGRALPRPPAKAAALIAWAALTGNEGVPRRRAAEVLWSGSHRSPEGALRQCLHALRRDVPPPLAVAVRADADRIAIDPALAEVDLWTFRRRAGELGGDALADAATLWRGDLLEGGPSLGDAFDRLLEVERLRLRRTATAVLQRLSVCASSPAQFEAAITLGTSLLMDDPWCEESCRALMGVLGRVGRRGDAERVYELCRRALQSDLGVAPASATASLHDAIREGRAARG